MYDRESPGGCRVSCHRERIIYADFTAQVYRRVLPAKKSCAKLSLSFPLCFLLLRHLVSSSAILCVLRIRVLRSSATRSASRFNGRLDPFLLCTQAHGPSRVCRSAPMGFCVMEAFFRPPVLLNTLSGREARVGRFKTWATSKRSQTVPQK